MDRKTIVERARVIHPNGVYATAVRRDAQRQKGAANSREQELRQRVGNVSDEAGLRVKRPVSSSETRSSKETLSQEGLMERNKLNKSTSNITAADNIDQSVQKRSLLEKNTERTSARTSKQ